MGSLLLHLLSVGLGVLFIFLGQLKLTSQFFPGYHTRMINEFGKFNKEFPLHQQTGWRPYAKNYRIAVGITEVVGGVFLLIGFQQTLATIVLWLLAINAILTFQKLNYSMEYTVVSIAVAFLLVLHLVLASKSTVKQAAKSVKEKVKKQS